MSKKLVFAAFAASAALAVSAVSPVAGQQPVADEAGLAAVDGQLTLLSEHHLAASVDGNGDKLVSVIVKLESQPLASYDGDIAGLPATSPQVTGDAKLDAKSSNAKKYKQHLDKEHKKFAADLAAASPEATVTQDFDVVIGGVAALVPMRDLDKLANISGVQGVFLDQLEQLDTEVSPEFIGADDLWADLGGQENAGEGVTVAVIDSGIWPEHPSLSDPDPFGNAYPAPPVVPGSNGYVGPTNACDFGNTTYNVNDAPFTCNNKLIGAYNFNVTYTAVIGLLPTEFDSARDSNGHGTHTATTSAGNGGVTATLLGVPRGTVSGVAPRAHVLVYKACGADGCFGSDTAAAVQQAILDGADVLNYSISGGSNPYGDATSLAFLDAYNAGMLVNPSAGNSGPGADTVAHREPWTLTVGASTTDRHFLSTVTLVADNSDTLELTGASVTDGIGTSTPVVFPPAGSELCLTPFAAGTFSGEIVICERGVIARVAKSFNVAEGGAGGLLLYNPTLQGLSTDNFFIPGVHLENDSGAELLAFMGSHTGVTGTFTQGTATAVQGDVMAPFSSRGGPAQTLGISKPDVTAPGVQILAGNTPMPENQDGGLPGQLFQSIQGTSMSAPHSTGAAALVKAAHPDWGPGEIKSALMMTAKTAGVTKEDGFTQADAFDYGSGRILPDAAADAALVMSESGANYLALEDNLWNANYPSLYVPVLPGAISVLRTVTNPTSKNGSWKLSVDAPSDLGVRVPKSLNVKKNGGDKTFRITVDARNVPNGEVRHAMVTFTKNNNPNKGQQLHFPITIVRGDAGVTIDKTCDPAIVERKDDTTCTITIENKTFDDAAVRVLDRVPKQLKLDKNSIVGGTKLGSKAVYFSGTLAGATPPAPDLAYGSGPPFGYLPLAGFGGTIDIGASDESIANFNVPSFDYAGQSYSTVGIVSNGYAVVGGGTGADVDFINTDLPDAAPPNNVLAPFWTDLNPAFGGRVLVNVLATSTDVWTVVEWESVENYSDGETNTVQMWIGSNTDDNPGEDITWAYGGDVSDGDGGFLTVGVENSFGNQGNSVYFDGSGTSPLPGDNVDVFSVPGAPGETHVITFDAEGKKVGDWTNYAYMWSDAFEGTAIAGFSGEVVK